MNNYSPPEYKNAMSKVMKLRKEEPVNENDYLFSELTKGELGRLKYHPNHLPTLGERWGRGIGLYRITLPSGARDTLDFFLDLIQPTQFKSSIALLDAIKTLSNYYRVTGSINNYRYLEGLERCGGYQNVEEEDFDRTVLNWVSYKEKPAWFSNTYKLAVKNVISRISQRRIREYLSPSDWLRNSDNWTTAGAIEIPLGEWNGHKIPKTKTAAAYFMTHRELYSNLMRKAGGVNRALPKPELSKVRAIIAGDFPTYLKMSYISYFIEYDMMGSDLSTLFMTQLEIYEMWKDLSDRIPEWCFPLDQGAFDQNISLEMILDTVYALKDFYGKRQNFLNFWFDQVIYAIKKGKVVLQNGDAVYHEGGVLSGWRWTALLDTIINLTQVECVRLTFIDRYGYDPLNKVVAQGDDDDLRIKDPKVADFFLNYYNEAGFEVNPSKMYVKRDRDDFLRKNIYKNIVVGPPARAVNAIIWQNPSSRGYERGLERISETVNNWLTLYGRGNWTKQLWDQMYVDLNNLTKISKRDLKRILTTPKTFGGLGVFEYDGGDMIAVKIIKEQLLEERVQAPKYLEEYWGISRGFLPQDVGYWGVPVVKETAQPMAVTGETRLVKMRQGAPKTTRAHWEDGVPRLGLREFVLEVWKDDPDKIRELVSNKADYDIIERKCRRSVFLDWLVGDLEIRKPDVPGVASDMVEVFFEKLSEETWGGLIRRGGVNRADVARMSMYVEFYTRYAALQYVKEYDWVLTP